MNSALVAGRTPAFASASRIFAAPLAKRPRSKAWPLAIANGDCPKDGSKPSLVATADILMPWTADTVFASH